MLTAERLREVLSYDPETGVFRWLSRISIRVTVGAQAGKVVSNVGYLRIQIDGHLFQAHRLAVLWMTGAWPVADVDHKNGDRADNRWSNLREASRSQNLGNMRALKSNNTSGIKGVWYDRRRDRWVAECADEYLGSFRTKEIAASAYGNAATRRYGEFAHF